MKPMKRFLAFTLSLSMLMSGAAALADTISRLKYR